MRLPLALHAPGLGLLFPGVLLPLGWPDLRLSFLLRFPLLSPRFPNLRLSSLLLDLFLMPLNLGSLSILFLSLPP